MVPGLWCVVPSSWSGLGGLFGILIGVPVQRTRNKRRLARWCWGLDRGDGALMRGHRWLLDGLHQQGRSRAGLTTWVRSHGSGHGRLLVGQSRLAAQRRSGHLGRVHRAVQRANAGIGRHRSGSKTSAPGTPGLVGCVVVSCHRPHVLEGQTVTRSRTSTTRGRTGPSCTWSAPGGLSVGIA